uniref:uncharacterized protein LOC100178222 isoform X1 n=2 Tax=Ciona intestinalis TaxID=7719 RepID=UPI00089DC224|nr:uncharacterized protein LOC100178222 isoform X1 [Ciona intestinalis]|eukprot:XP_018672775.1 uncharacterized protein LOC100178222 isoform X1 [Ciona intestinalis]
MILSMDCNKIATSIETEVLKIRDSKQWTKLPSQKGVEISFTDSPSFDGHCYKFSCIIEAPCEVVYGVLKPPPTTDERLRWDKSINGYQPLVTIDENTFISVITTPSILIGFDIWARVCGFVSMQTCSNKFHRGTLGVCG